MAPTQDASPSPAAPATLSPLDDTFGALLIGTFIGLVLYGIFVHQAYRYFKLYQDDERWLKVLVIVLLYFYLVTSYDKPERLITGTWYASSFISVLSLMIVTLQVYQLTDSGIVGGRYRLVVYVAILCLLGELAFFSLASAEAFIKPIFVDFQQYTWLISAGAAMVQAADMLLTTVLMIMLRNSRTGLKRMDTVLDTLMLYAMTTGRWFYPHRCFLLSITVTHSMNSVVNSLSFIFSLLFSSKLIYGATGIVCTKLYANSLLAALNARKSLTLRAMYDLDAHWVEVPVTPRRANALANGTPHVTVRSPVSPFDTPDFPPV
ncbi:hypothetical protein C8Q80DRAFT_1269839 [Daedaleopsis nitida]|nr:hypothetical protein C8Q80DRAFT_1269839 [Daedaleopsis nitida]